MSVDAYILDGQPGIGIRAGNKILDIVDCLRLGMKAFSHLRSKRRFVTARAE